MSLILQTFRVILYISLVCGGLFFLFFNKRLVKQYIKEDKILKRMRILTRFSLIGMGVGSLLVVFALLFLAP